MTTQWIGPDDRLDRLAMNLVGFLWKRSHTMKGWDRFSLENRPPYTNKSGEPRLMGWCGTTNDISVTGCGMAKVVRVAGNGRALVQILEGQDLKDALDELGYPELDPG